MAGVRTGEKRLRRAAWALVALQLACVLLPMGIVLLWSCASSWPWPALLPQEFSQRAFAALFSPAKNTGLVLAQSVGISLAVACVATLAASLAARALAFHRFAGKELFRFATVLPFLIPATVFAMGVQVFFIRAGLANTATGVVLAHSIVALPYAVSIMTDATLAAGKGLEEQARTCGAGAVRAFFHVQLPRLLPGMLSAASLSFITSFSQYFITLLIGGGAVETFALSMFPYLTSGDRSMASAYGVVFMAVTLGVFFVFEVLLKRFAARSSDYFDA